MHRITFVIFWFKIKLIIRLTIIIAVGEMKFQKGTCTCVYGTLRIEVTGQLITLEIELM